MRLRRKILLLCLLTTNLIPYGLTQLVQHPSPQMTQDAQAEASQTAEILGLASSIRELKEVQTKRPCTTPPDITELTLKQQLLESETSATLDIDGVLAEISAERSDLSDLRTTLQGRRDRTVGYLNAASLITGSGVGIAVNATQLSNSTASAGDYLGIGSGIASTILSLVAVRKMHGPQQSVGTVPNMLAPLFDQNAVLNSYYPPEVLKYLDSVPPTQDPGRGTRLEQMKSAWVNQGRIGSSSSEKNHAKILALTSSENQNVKLSIDDLSDRIAMLNDVGARVALMKRDIATLMRGYQTGKSACLP